HPIFKHKECDFYLAYLYLSHLYLNKQLTYPSVDADLPGFLAAMKARESAGEAIFSVNQDCFLQGYLYLMRLEDYAVEMKVLMAGESNANAAIALYVNQLIIDYPNLSEEKIHQAIAGLSGINKMFFLIEVSDADTLLRTIERPGGFVSNMATPINRIVYQSNECLVIPPVELTKWIARECCPGSEIEMEPIFGTVGTETLYNDFHRNNKRPISLVSNDVKTSLKMAHDLPSTRFSVPIHDIYYHYMALSFLFKDDLHFILEVLLPEMKVMLNDGAASGMAYSLKKADILKAIDGLNDFAAESDTKGEFLSANELELLRSQDLSMPTRLVSYIESVGNKDSNFLPILMALANVLSQKEALNTQYHIDVSVLMEELFQSFLSRLKKHPLIERGNPVFLDLVCQWGENRAGVIDAINFLIENQLLTKELIMLLTKHADKFSTDEILINIHKQNPSVLQGDPAILDWLLLNASLVFPYVSPWLISLYEVGKKKEAIFNYANNVNKAIDDVVAKELINSIYDTASVNHPRYSGHNVFYRCADSLSTIKKYNGVDKDFLGPLGKKVKPTMIGMCNLLYGYRQEELADNGANIQAWLIKNRDMLCSASFLILFSLLIENKYLLPRENFEQLRTYGEQNKFDFTRVIILLDKLVGINRSLLTVDSFNRLLQQPALVFAVEALSSAVSSYDIGGFFSQPLSSLDKDLVKKLIHSICIGGKVEQKDIEQLKKIPSVSKILENVHISKVIGPLIEPSVVADPNRRHGDHQ
ncbi:MAG: hypothetical protein ACYC0J_09235, partial [Gammaproteobacteria bacterium]